MQSTTLPIAGKILFEKDFIVIGYPKCKGYDTFNEVCEYFMERMGCDEGFNEKELYLFPSSRREIEIIEKYFRVKINHFNVEMISIAEVDFADEEFLTLGC